MSDDLREKAAGAFRAQHLAAEKDTHRKALAEWQRALNKWFEESGLADLVDRVATGAASQEEIGKLRTEIGDLYCYTLQCRHETDLHTRASKAWDEQRKTIYARAEKHAGDRVMWTVAHAMDGLRSEAVAMMKALSARPDDPLAGRAQVLLHKLDLPTEPGTIQQTLDDMLAARDKLVEEKRALWNSMQAAIQVHHDTQAHDTLGKAGKCAMCAVLYKLRQANKAIKR